MGKCWIINRLARGLPLDAKYQLVFHASFIWFLLLSIHKDKKLEWRHMTHCHSVAQRSADTQAPEDWNLWPPTQNNNYRSEEWRDFKPDQHKKFTQKINLKYRLRFQGQLSILSRRSPTQFGTMHWLSDRSDTRVSTSEHEAVHRKCI